MRVIAEDDPGGDHPFWNDMRPDPAAQWLAIRLHLAETFGWTLDYIDQLADDDPLMIHRVMGYLQGQAKASEAKSKG